MCLSGDLKCTFGIEVKPHAAASKMSITLATHDSLTDSVALEIRHTDHSLPGHYIGSSRLRQVDSSLMLQARPKRCEYDREKDEPFRCMIAFEHSRLYIRWVPVLKRPNCVYIRRF